MYDLKNLQPIQMEDLIRVGRDSDGGYVLSKRQIAATETLLSFGISDDWSFEIDFLKQKACKLYACDQSVSASILKNKSLYHFARMIERLLRFNITRAKMHRERWRYLSHQAKDFTRFFQEKLQRHFISKFLGEKDDETFIRLDTILSDLTKNAPDYSIFIKMDIETGEYRTLPQLQPFCSKINGLTVEFHELDIVEKKFNEIIDILSDRFYIVHVHANNYMGLIYNTDLPKALEITFINKMLVANPINPSSLSYPVKGLDFPCVESQDDIILAF
jgi:intracellular sulfur oxidation DsrE/DsrF family protein